MNELHDSLLQYGRIFAKLMNRQQDLHSTRQSLIVYQLYACANWKHGMNSILNTAYAFSRIPLLLQASHHGSNNQYKVDNFVPHYLPFDDEIKGRLSGMRYFNRDIAITILTTFSQTMLDILKMLQSIEIEEIFYSILVPIRSMTSYLTQSTLLIQELLAQGTSHQRQSAQKKLQKTLRDIGHHNRFIYKQFHTLLSRDVYEIKGRLIHHTLGKRYIDDSLQSMLEVNTPKSVLQRLIEKHAIFHDLSINHEMIMINSMEDDESANDGQEMGCCRKDRKYLNIYKYMSYLYHLQYKHLQAKANIIHLLIGEQIQLPDDLNEEIESCITLAYEGIAVLNSLNVSANTIGNDVESQLKHIQNTRYHLLQSIISVLQSGCRYFNTIVSNPMFSLEDEEEFDDDMEDNDDESEHHPQHIYQEKERRYRVIYGIAKKALNSLRCSLSLSQMTDGSDREKSESQRCQLHRLRSESLIKIVNRELDYPINTVKRRGNRHDNEDEEVEEVVDVDDDDYNDQQGSPSRHCQRLLSYEERVQRRYELCQSIDNEWDIALDRYSTLCCDDNVIVWMSEEYKIRTLYLNILQSMYDYLHDSTSKPVYIKEDNINNDSDIEYLIELQCQRMPNRKREGQGIVVIEIERRCKVLLTNWLRLLPTSLGIEDDDSVDAGARQCPVIEYDRTRRWSNSIESVRQLQQQLIYAELLVHRGKFIFTDNSGPNTMTMMLVSCCEVTMNKLTVLLTNLQPFVFTPFNITPSTVSTSSDRLLNGDVLHCVIYWIVLGFELVDKLTDDYNFDSPLNSLQLCVQIVCQRMVVLNNAIEYLLSGMKEYTEEGDMVTNIHRAEELYDFFQQPLNEDAISNDAVNCLRSFETDRDEYDRILNIG